MSAKFPGGGAGSFLADSLLIAIMHESYAAGPQKRDNAESLDSNISRFFDSSDMFYIHFIIL